jgi:hypothetical protein
MDWQTTRQLGFIVVFGTLAGCGFVFMTLSLLHHATGH